ncbi:MAG: radical SAM protein [Candidatus Thorarchaeota archaeon]|nr:MAG: radical SAM protein [Candidatus Thorarchaeota archaeon]
MSKSNLTSWRGTSFYINPTSRCTNSCIFCVRNFSEGVFGFNLQLDEDPTPEELVDEIEMTWNGQFDDIAIVGFGEPTINIEGTLAAIRTIKKLSPVEVRMNTNGQALLIHHNRDIATELAEAGLDRIQISLNAPDPDTYLRLCQPSFGRMAFDSMLEFTERCKPLMRVELSAVDIPGVDMDACRSIANRLNVEFRERVFKGPEGAIEGILRTLSI